MGAAIKNKMEAAIMKKMGAAIMNKMEAAIMKKMEAGDAETGKKLLRLFLILNVILHIASIIAMSAAAYRVCLLKYIFSMITERCLLCMLAISPMLLVSLYVIWENYGYLRVNVNLLLLLYEDNGQDKLRVKFKGEDAEFLEERVVWWGLFNFVMDQDQVDRHGSAR